MLRANNGENKHQYKESMARSGSQSQLKTLFSQNDPQLYFHKSPGLNKKLPNLNKDNQATASPTNESQFNATG